MPPADLRRGTRRRLAFFLGGGAGAKDQEQAEKSDELSHFSLQMLSRSRTKVHRDLVDRWSVSILSGETIGPVSTTSHVFVPESRRPLSSRVLRAAIDILGERDLRVTGVGKVMGVFYAAPLQRKHPNAEAFPG